MKMKLTLVELLVVIGILALALTCVGGDIPPVQIMGELLLGWAPFLGRLPQRMQWRWEVIWSVMIYATLLVIGGHLFARWLYQQMKGGQWRFEWSLRFFLIFILMFAAGTSAVAIVHQTTWVIREPGPMFSHTGPSRERANRMKCSSNLRQIGQGIELYAKEHGGKYPDDIQQLIIHADVNPEVLICPSSNHERATGATTQELAANAHKDLHHSYLYLGKGLVQPVKAELVIAYERKRNHEDDGMNVLFADGHFEWFAAESMKKLMAQIDEGGGKAISYDSK
jgi:prepilin-type processing-associated H-X9-DG protein